MKLQTHFSLLASVALSFGLCGAAAQAQGAPIQPAQAQPAQAQPAPPAPAAAAALTPKTPSITEEMLRQRFQGKMIFLRGLYAGDDLGFDMDGKVKGSPATASFTLSALQVRKVSLSKRKVDFEADRYALHFDGALPYESNSQSFDKVKISKKPVHISIDRELVVTPKVKKTKAQNQKKDVAAKGVAPLAAAPASPAAPAAAAPALAPGTTTSPAHSAMLLNAALDKIFASDIDSRMVARLPPYWQRYFESKRDHHEFQPTDPNVLEVGGDVTAPRVLNSIDPSSNQYAQKYGITGLTLFRTVVDATGKPQQIAIARPIGFGLDEEAVDAIKASHFEPAMKDGKPVPVVIDVVVTFRIYSNRTRPGSVAKGQKLTQAVASAWDAGTTDGSSKPIQ